MSSHPSFKRPILSSVYRISGALCIIGGVLALCSSIFAAVNGSDGGALAGVTMFGGAIGAAVICFGIAQVLDYIAKTAYHAERCDLALTSQAASRQAAPAVASRAPRHDSPRLTGVADSATAACPSCMAELDVRTIRRGSNTCPTCGIQFTAE